MATFCTIVQGWALPCDDWKTVSVNPAVNGYLFLCPCHKMAEGHIENGRRAYRVYPVCVCVCLFVCVFVCSFVCSRIVSSP